MERPTRGFLRLLKIVDPTYYVRMRPEAGLYEIIKDKDVRVWFPDGTVRWRKEPRVVGTYRYCSDGVISELQYRKWLGRQMNIVDKPMAEINAMRAAEKERMAKIKEEGYDQMAYGGVDSYKMGRRHSVNLDAEKRQNSAGG
ncbi:MAG: hypothetical protein WC455_17980 [Dehalococcoidia bacterium]|jgi:hypothetical protein